MNTGIFDLRMILFSVNGLQTCWPDSGRSCNCSWAAIRELARLRRRYGRGRWRKLKGIARVRLVDGSIHTAEVHWYEAHGIGRKELKLKFPLLD